MSSTNSLNKTRYTHRDYESIKGDLVEAIPSLTQEWTSREESDPGIVLIKLISMFGDTLSYNTDKIALETYLPTVTQRKNCAKILELLGYKMHWYRAARVLAYVRLKDSSVSRQVILTPYQTIFRAGNISYVVLPSGIDSTEQIVVDSEVQAKAVRLIQGRSMTVSFSQSELVNNRYYLGSSNVDETEIKLFVKSSSVPCELVENLYLVSSSTKVYFEFDVDEYDRPYIQLASGWENIVNSSNSTKFELTYIINDGSLGNISSNAFTGASSIMGATIKNLVITNLPNTTKYGIDGQDLDSYNSPGYDPQQVEDAREDAANYVLTHDTLVTTSDYEKAAKRTTGITISKMVDAQVVINDGLLLEMPADTPPTDQDLDGVVHRALDRFDTVIEDGVSYLKPSQVILYLAYQNFESNYNYYVSSPSAGDWRLSASNTYWSSYNKSASGYYPYRPNENILQSVRESIRSLQTLNVVVDFGTIKLFPFKVKGTLYLTEPRSPQETLQIVNTVDTALEIHYYPSQYAAGELPNFIDIVDTIQNADVRIKYFDAVSNIVEWSPVTTNWINTAGHDFDKLFDTTSAILYYGLSDEFNLNKKFLTYRFKNVGVSDEAPSGADVGLGWGTAYLVNYSIAQGIYDPDHGNYDIVTIPSTSDSVTTLKLNSVQELRALCEDLETAEGTVMTDASTTIRYNNTGLQWIEV